MNKNYNNKKDLVIFVPSIEDGGVEKNLFLVSNYLANNGIQVNVITANLNKKKKYNKKVNFISPNNNFFNNKNRFYKTIYCFFLLLNFFFRKKNFVILSFQANIYAIFFSFFFRLKIITRSNTAPDGWSSNILKRLLFRIFFKYPEKIIVNSYEFKNKLDREFKIKSLCIYNPFDRHLIKKKLKKKVKIPIFKNKKIKIINIGRMTDQKDQISLLKSINQIKDKINFGLIILGKGKNKMKLKNYILSNDLKKNVKLIGYKKNPYPYIKSSNLFILPSKFEGLPNVLLEAQYFKKFIISSKCPTGPNEILLRGKAGFLYKQSNIKQLGKKIITFAKHKNSRFIKKKIIIGFNSMQRFDYNINMKKYLNLVNKYLN